MPQILESDVRQSGPFQDGLEVLVDQAVHIHWPSEFRNEDQVHDFWPFFGICQHAETEFDIPEDKVCRYVADFVLPQICDLIVLSH